TVYPVVVQSLLTAGPRDNQILQIGERTARSQIERKRALDHLDHVGADRGREPCRTCPGRRYVSSREAAGCGVPAEVQVGLGNFVVAARPRGAGNFGSLFALELLVLRSRVGLALL